jgi:hypothetical protein
VGDAADAVPGRVQAEAGDGFDDLVGRWRSVKVKNTGVMAPTSWM